MKYDFSKIGYFSNNVILPPLFEKNEHDVPWAFNQYINLSELYDFYAKKEENKIEKIDDDTELLIIKNGNIYDESYEYHIALFSMVKKKNIKNWKKIELHYDTTRINDKNAKHTENDSVIYISSDAYVASYNKGKTKVADLEKGFHLVSLNSTFARDIKIVNIENADTPGTLNNVGFNCHTLSSRFDIDVINVYGIDVIND